LKNTRARNVKGARRAENEREAPREIDRLARHLGGLGAARLLLLRRAGHLEAEQRPLLRAAGSKLARRLRPEDRRVPVGAAAGVRRPPEELLERVRAGSPRAFGQLLLFEEIRDREADRTGWRNADGRRPDDDDLERDLRAERCAVCGEHRTAELDDPCIARLPGVEFACCGHGRRGGGYLVGAVFGRVYGPAAARKMRELGGNPPPAAFELDPIGTFGRLAFELDPIGDAP
jgi:hypothetical protein